ncbi:hypothetical protein JXA32_10965 [Candidatus Sumerlaeota bacterium]|nr:hypothetical protein [Candidatus Sumerlaeota bacterium]
MAVVKYTIVFESRNGRRKLFKLWFGADGSYYVTVPYHSAKKAILFKQTVNYATSAWRTVDDGDWIPVEQAIDIASADDARIKLSHHPDGFLQFSGKGILSGRNSDASAKGIGTLSWPLKQGCHGPAFSVTISGVDDFESADTCNDLFCLFRETDLTVIPGVGPLVIEGHYFPVMWRRFVQTHSDGSKTIPIVHPSGAVLNLRVLLPSDKCPIGGFFGLDIFGNLGTFEGTLSKSGFALSSSTGNVRMNEHGQKIGDGLYCFYPRPDGICKYRSIDYPQ